MRISLFLLLLIFNSARLFAGDDKSFYSAWGLSYQTNRVEVTNAMTLYGGGGFFGPAPELRRGNARFNSSNLAFHIEDVSVNRFVLFKTTFLGITGKDKDSAGYSGKQREKVVMKAGLGFKIRNLGVQFGGSMVFGEKNIYNSNENNGMNIGTYYYSTSTNYGIQHWDRMSYLEWGLLLQLVYKFNDHCGIRASVNSGWLRNSRRNVKGTSTEREIKFYYTNPKSSKNVGLFFGYRYSQHLVDGQNEFEVFHGNEGIRRFPAAFWKQRTIHFGLNIPIKFKG